MTLKISEFDLQRAFCIWLDDNLAPGVVYWHTPNGGQRNAFEAKRFKEIGVKPGIPDLFFLRAGRLYAMEWKEPGKGRLSNTQNLMGVALQGAGLAAYIVVSDLPTARDWCFKFMLTVNK